MSFTGKRPWSPVAAVVSSSQGRVYWPPKEMKTAQAEHFDALVLGSGSGGMGMTPVRIVA